MTPEERAELVESIAAGFDARALQARINGALDPAGRDIDVVLAWECAARWIREHAAGRPGAAAAAVSSPTGTPERPRTINCCSRGFMTLGAKHSAECTAPATSPTGDPTDGLA